MKTLRDKWDKKAQNYNRYTTDDRVLEAAICQKIEAGGIDLTGKQILDIGCGTGAYTLRFAQKAKHIDAVDISPEMLRILREDAHSNHLNNITTHVSSWEAYPTSDTPYDIAIATMFPALKKHQHFQKMHRCATIKLFLGWGGKRGTELIEALFETHGGIYQPPNSATTLKAWLESEQHPYQVIEHTEEKTRIKPWEEAIENYSWHLKVRGMPPERKKIIEVLEQYRNAEGEVVERTMNYLNLVIWR